MNPSGLGPVLNPDSVIGCLELPSRRADANSGCQAEEAPWTEKRTALHIGFLMSELGCSTVAGDLLLDCRVAVRADWDRGVSVTVGEVAVSLQGRGAVG